jgi:hypothetical protein
MMRTFDRVEERRRKVARPRDVEERLPMHQAAAVIAGLAVLSWGAVILLGTAIRAII